MEVGGVFMMVGLMMVRVRDKENVMKNVMMGVWVMMKW